MNIHQLHARLSSAVRQSAQLRQELEHFDGPTIGRWVCRGRYLYCQLQVQALTNQLRTLPFST